MPRIRRTIVEPGKPDEVKTFSLPLLSGRVVGRGVNNKVIYDLKKRGTSTVTEGLATITFEVL